MRITQRLNIAAVQGLAQAISLNAHMLGDRAKYFESADEKVSKKHDEALVLYQQIHTDLEALEVAFNRMRDTLNELER